jgi:hypothetical protein
MITGRGAGCLVFTAENAVQILHADRILFQELLKFKVTARNGRIGRAPHLSMC